MTGATAHATDEDLEAVCRRVRRLILGSVVAAGAGHIGGPLSAVEILVSLYFRVLNIRPTEPAWPERDRFVLSKGHSSIALYSVLALRGFLAVEELETFDQVDSRLQGHPDMTRLPGLDMSTGSLGVGLSTGVGMALGARRLGSHARVFVLLGDGECQEGQVWEAADFAARNRLGGLIGVVDHNRLQQFGVLDASRADQRRPWQAERLAGIWRAFGWRVLRVDGHDLGALERTLPPLGRDPRDVPTVVIADTIKGRGVSFMEDRFEWHARVPRSDELQRALDELIQ